MNEREPDYYAILNLPPDSSIEAVREQYRRLVMVFHPDRNGGDRWCEQQLMLVNNAHRMLSDPEWKAHYDLRRNRRSADTIDFGDAFDTEMPVRDEPAEESSWTFTASTPSSDAETKSGGANPAWSGLFAEAPVATATFRPVHSDPIRQPTAGRGGYAAAAALILIAAAFFAGEHHARGRMVSSANAQGGPYVRVGSARNPSGDAAAADMAIMSAAAISPEDVRRADAERHDEALAVRARIAPYWTRFKRAEPGAEAAIITGKNLLSAMQSLDRRQLGGSAPIGSDRFRDEAKLSSDIQELQDKISDIQARFDDLDYLTGGNDVADSLAEIDRLLRSIEHEDDPLFSDLRIAAAETGGRHA